MKLILGVSGSISAFKSVEILRIFQKAGHQVSVILTQNATEFITPLTFETFTPGNVYTAFFGRNKAADPLIHITLAQEGDLLLVAPATANIIGKFANGIADDLLSTTFLAFTNRIVIAPAMNTAMYQNPAVQDNVKRLKQRNVEILEPEEGSLACRVEGKGRMPEAEDIFNHCTGKLSV
jgi:phosphopantothenoylcysteine decarboxylase/phosphopantothenate--cysteine ligase